MPRYTWEQISQIPFTNGIYIIFEKDGQYHGMERVVRVGTHRLPDRLRTRLSDHFVKKDHGGSIFRKNIGKAILNAYWDPYLETWTVDTSKPEKHAYINKKKNADTERRVSKFLRERFSFTVFQMTDKNERLRMKETIIAGMDAESEFMPGSKWSDIYSLEQEIRESGMWLKQGLNGKPITEAEAILGFKLPNSAYIYSMWRNPNGHPHCQAWLQAGFSVKDVAESIRTKIITFERIG